MNLAVAVCAQEIGKTRDVQRIVCTVLNSITSYVSVLASPSIAEAKL